MKVLMINGSPKANGNTFVALKEVAQSLESNGIETVLVNIGKKPVQGCIACNKCKEIGHCIFGDDLYRAVREQLESSDALIVGSPVFYGGPNGSLCALLDRIFYSSSSLLAYKPGAAVVVARRGGTTAAFDRLNKYFTILNMPVVSSQYWNNIHGLLPGEASRDMEGLQIMRTLGVNMVWLLKNLKNGGEPRPQSEPRQTTNFIR